jgi:hypothetical protein
MRSEEGLAHAAAEPSGLLRSSHSKRLPQTLLQLLSANTELQVIH